LRSRDRNKYEAFGQLFFCTSTIVGFIDIFNYAPLCEIVINDLSFYQKRGDIRILAYAIMPNHLHLVVRVDDGKTISQCIGNVKRITSRHIGEWLRHNDQQLMAKLDDYSCLEPAPDCRIWKPRFDSLVITQEWTLRQKIAYIHNNPVKSGLVRQPEDWPFSSAASYAGIGNPILDVDTRWETMGYGCLSSGKGSQGR